jgi:glycosyltransferase involved in cell wall biosynthesis
MKKFLPKIVETVVIINDYAFINGGAGKVALISAKALVEKGIRVILFTGMGPVDEKLLKAGVEVICLMQEDILTDPNRLRAIKKGLWNSIAMQEFDKILSKLDICTTIIHFHTWTKVLSASLFRVSAKYGFKTVITLHDYFSLCPNGAFYNFKKNQTCHLKSLSIKCILSNCDSRSFFQKQWRVIRQFIQDKEISRNKKLYFLTISKLNKRLLVEHIKDENIKIFDLINPIELNYNEKVNVEQNKLFIYIGRLSTEKGCELFCKAITELNLQGAVLGDGYLYKDLKEKYPNIEFVGWVDRTEMGKYLYKTRALVFPTLLYEGAPLTVMEMKSYGIPCIVSDISSATEEIINEKTGYIFKSGCLDSLKTAINKVKNINLSIIADEINENFDTVKFSLETHTSNLLEIYDKILEN